MALLLLLLLLLLFCHPSCKAGELGTGVGPSGPEARSPGHLRKLLLLLVLQLFRHPEHARARAGRETRPDTALPRDSDSRPFNETNPDRSPRPP